MNKKIILFVILFLYSFGTVSSLSLVVRVPEKYTNVIAGERFYFEIEVKYPENMLRKDLRLEYEILNKDGDLIAQSKVLKAVETQASFIDFIVIPQNTGFGQHFIKVRVRDYEDLYEEVEASFYVEKYGSDKIQTYFFILLGAIIFVGILVLANIILSKKN